MDPYAAEESREGFQVKLAYVVELRTLAREEKWRTICIKSKLYLELGMYSSSNDEIGSDSEQRLVL